MEGVGDDLENTHNVRVVPNDTSTGGVVSRLQVYIYIGSHAANLHLFFYFVCTLILVVPLESRLRPCSHTSVCCPAQKLLAMNNGSLL